MRPVTSCKFLLGSVNANGIEKYRALKYSPLMLKLQVTFIKRLSFKTTFKGHSIIKYVNNASTKDVINTQAAHSTLEIVPKTRYETSWAVFWSLNHTCFQTKTAPKPYPLGRHIPICVIWGSTALPLPRDCFHCGTRGDDLFSLFHCTIWEAFRKIDTNELHDI